MTGLFSCHLMCSGSSGVLNIYLRKDRTIDLYCRGKRVDKNKTAFSYSSWEGEEKICVPSLLSKSKNE